MLTRAPNEEMKQAIRQRIVFMDEGQQEVLHEGKLAKEFGVSRTPVRQVLQALAMERLLVVRSGVGTIAAPLDPDRFMADQHAFLTILRAGQTVHLDKARVDAAIDFQMTELQLKQVARPDELERYFRCASQFLAGLLKLCSDEIIGEALTAIFWRFIRRRVEAQGRNVEGLCAELALIVDAADIGLQNGGASLCYHNVEKAVEDMLKETVELRARN